MQAVDEVNSEGNYCRRNIASINVPRIVRSDIQVKRYIQSAGRGNIMGMVLKKQSVLLTLMDLRVRVNVFDLEN